MPFIPIAALARQLMRDEGKRLTPYNDSVGKLTIGYGRNLADCGISEDEAQYLLSNDIRRAAADVEKFIPWSTALDQVRLAALVNASFNLGIGGLLKFKKALAALEKRDYETCAKELLDSEWAQQVGPRAVRIAQQLKTGEWT